MVHVCAVYGCHERAEKGTIYKFYPFPQVRKGGINCVMSEIKLRRRLAWYQALKRSDFTESELTYRRICSKHFISGVPAGDKDETNPDWIPSLHIGYRNSNSSGTAELKCAKWKRYQERKKKSSKSSLNLQRDRKQSFSGILKMTRDTVKTILVDEVRNIAESEPIYCQNIEQVVDSSLLKKTDGSNLSFPVNHSVSLGNNDLITSTHCSSEAQTDFTWEGIDLSAILIDLQNRIEENRQLKAELSKKTRLISQLMLDESAFVNNDKMVRFFTGLSNAQALTLILGEIEPALTKIKVKKMNNFQKLLMTLMKLRMNISNMSLSYRFGLDLKQINRIFTKVIAALDFTFKNFIHWPDRESMQSLMPPTFEEQFGSKVAVIIDCFEIIIQRPSTLRGRSQTSNYKQRQTVKYLVGITAHGVISFISRGYGGCTTDDYIAEHCGLLDHLIPGDVILADRGFIIKEIIGVRQAELKTPAFEGKKTQINVKNIEQTKEIAAVRVHVEQVMRSVRKKYRFLNGPIPISMLSKISENEIFLDSILRVCCILSNLCEPIISL